MKSFSAEFQRLSQQGEDTLRRSTRLYPFEGGFESTFRFLVKLESLDAFRVLKP